MYHNFLLSTDLELWFSTKCRILGSINLQKHEFPGAVGFNAQASMLQGGIVLPRGFSNPVTLVPDKEANNNFKVIFQHSRSWLIIQSWYNIATGPLYSNITTAYCTTVLQLLRHQSEMMLNLFCMTLRPSGNPNLVFLSFLFPCLKKMPLCHWFSCCSLIYKDEKSIQLECFFVYSGFH